MPSLFEAPDRDALLARLSRLEPGATRLWGTMTPAQALAHCTIGLEAATGDRPTPQKLFGRLLSPLVRRRALGPEAAGRRQHVFFGRLTGDEWGRLMHKHLDHHLRQFGV